MRPDNIRMQTLVVVVALVCSGWRVGRAENLAINGGFEDGAEGWNVFVPEESQGAGCRFEVVQDGAHEGANCASLHSTGEARFGVGSGNAISVAPGEHYRVSAWVRADRAAQVRAKAPGFVIRLSLRTGSEDTKGGHLYIVYGNQVSQGTPAAGKPDLPKQWTKVEAVVTIPAGADAMFPTVFAWWVNGTIFVDDLVVEKM